MVDAKCNCYLLPDAVALTRLRRAVRQPIQVQKELVFVCALSVCELGCHMSQIGMSALTDSLRSQKMRPWLLCSTGYICICEYLAAKPFIVPASIAPGILYAAFQGHDL